MRNIFIVNASQVVTSESHPEGLFSIVDGYPKFFDSRSYPAPDGDPNGNEEMALNMAESAYYAQLSQNKANTNINRVMTAVTLMTAAGQRIMGAWIGQFPNMAPENEVADE